MLTSIFLCRERYDNIELTVSVLVWFLVAIPSPPPPPIVAIENGKNDRKTAAADVTFMVCLDFAAYCMDDVFL
jgi:hypothetical protein